MKSKEELDALKEEVEALGKKLADLSEEELEQVDGGKKGPWIEIRMFRKGKLVVHRERW